MDLIRTHIVVVDIIVTVTSDGRLPRFCFFGIFIRLDLALRALHYHSISLIEGGHLFRRIKQERCVKGDISIHLSA